MDAIDHLKANWEQLARHDAMWAILNDPSRTGQKWDQEAFFATGRREVDLVLKYVASLGLNVDPGGTALDFGCGVGRLTQALAAYFERCIGVDISATMVEKANGFNRYDGRCSYVVNDRSDLSLFTDGQFDFVYTSIVLQHVGSEAAKNYIKEFVRILKTDGVLVFQVPHDYRPDPSGRMSPLARLRVKLGVRTRIQKMLSPEHGADMTNVTSLIEMHCVPEEEVRRIIGAAGAVVRDVRVTNSTDLDFNGNLVFLEQEPAYGYVSRQYCVVKGGG